MKPWPPAACYIAKKSSVSWETVTSWAVPPLLGLSRTLHVTLQMGISHSWKQNSSLLQMKMFKSHSLFCCSFFLLAEWAFLFILAKIIHWQCASVVSQPKLEAILVEEKSIKIVNKPFPIDNKWEIGSFFHTLPCNHIVIAV